ncbi:hypothetical protein [Sneathiella litorea]|uniref:Uncharacterized protein n=1 Tax=Sneathiella litorea TaxID=2606216 RepID=A0A6L8W899_9PROT|nr:hypothetical protein [Sneathiella litorea]MZR30889.1 hypothetical protein [Sneathiella litorea]
MGAFVTSGELPNIIWLAVEGLTCLVTLATLVTALTPTRWNMQCLDRLFQMLNLIAGNVGHNRNADDR